MSILMTTNRPLPEFFATAGPCVVFLGVIVLASASLFTSASAALTQVPGSPSALADDPSSALEPPADYLTFVAGAVPVAFSANAADLRVGMEHAMRAIDGDGGGYVLTPRPGSGDTRLEIVYELPSMTTFEEFAVPNVLETPSPSQTFFRDVEIAGSDAGPEGPFDVLATTTLETHAARGDTTRFAATTRRPVRWVRLALTGGIDVQRDQTFFEFSELIGTGTQEAVPLSETFTGTWRGRGVRITLSQDGRRVTGCYDDDGRLEGSVDGRILRAVGITEPAGIRSGFVLQAKEDGSIVGVRSTNGAPFRLYEGAAAPGETMECPSLQPPPPACGAVLHGIQFDFDSAVIREESEALLAELARGLKGESEANPSIAITVIGHTSSEGSDAYNRNLSLRRSVAVIDALVDNGVGAGRLSADGRGEDAPIADNATEAGRSLNRRVEIQCR